MINKICLKVNDKSHAFKSLKFNSFSLQNFQILSNAASEVYSKPFQTSKKKRFAKRVNGF